MALGKGFLQPFKYLIFLAQAGVNHRDEVRRNILLFCSFLQLGKHLQSFASLPGNGVSMSKRGDGSDVAIGKINRLLNLGDCLRILPLLHINLANPEVGPGVIRIQLERLAIIFKGLIKAVRVIQRITYVGNRVRRRWIQLPAEFSFGSCFVETAQALQISSVPIMRE